MAPVALEHENFLPGMPIPVEEMLLRLLAFLGRLLGMRQAFRSTATTERTRG
jgi:hypothetical protein